MPRDRRSQNRPLVTPRQALVSNDPDSADALWNVLTPAMDTSSMNRVRVSYWLQSADVDVRPGIQFSDDGVEWPYDPIAIQGPQSFSSTEGWVAADEWQALFDTSSTVDLTGDVKLWCRFGLFAINSSAGAETRSAIAALSIDIRHVPLRTVRVPWTRLQTDGTTTAMFNPVTEPLDAERFKELRATVEFGANTGNIEVQPAYRVTDTPEDWSGFSTVATFGSNVTTEGMAFGTTFDSATFEGSYVQLGFNVKNGSAGSHEICRATLRVDLRGCPS